MITAIPTQPIRAPLTAASARRLQHRAVAWRASAVVLEREGLTTRAAQLRTNADRLEAMISAGRTQELARGAASRA